MSEKPLDIPLKELIHWERTDPVWKYIRSEVKKNMAIIRQQLLSEEEGSELLRLQGEHRALQGILNLPNWLKDEARVRDEQETEETEAVQPMQGVI